MGAEKTHVLIINLKDGFPLGDPQFSSVIACDNIGIGVPLIEVGYNFLHLN
jgi:hypothetical protein